MCGNQAGRKAKKQLIRCIDPARGTTKLEPRAGSMQRWESRFAIFRELERPVHLPPRFAGGEYCRITTHWNTHSRYAGAVFTSNS